VLIVVLETRYTSGKDVQQLASIALMLCKAVIWVCQHAATIMERLRGNQQTMAHAQCRIVVLVPVMLAYMQVWINQSVVKNH
jgi:hypothetical protein